MRLARKAIFGKGLRLKHLTQFSSGSTRSGFLKDSFIGTTPVSVQYYKLEYLLWDCLNLLYNLEYFLGIASTFAIHFKKDARSAEIEIGGN
jgi:hypothetical protein